MDSIDLALAQLKLDSNAKIAHFAKKFNVDRSTLSRRYNGVTQSVAVRHQEQQLLSARQEEELVRYINQLTEQGLPPTIAMLYNFAVELSGRQPSKNWPHRFIKRHSDVLASGNLALLDISRKKANNWHEYRYWFTLIDEKTRQYQIEPHNMYNIDEKGFLIGVLTKARRVFNKAAVTTSKIIGPSQDGNRSWITVMATICADGTSIPPILIYQALTGDLQDSWL